MKRNLLSILVGSAAVMFALPLGGATTLYAQTSLPTQTVQKLKEYIDQNEIEDICKLMAENDGSAPLSAKNFDAMRASMENLVPLWQGELFSYGATTIDESKQPARAVVNLQVYRLKQEVRITLLRFDTIWYIANIEIFFK